MTARSELDNTISLLLKNQVGFIAKSDGETLVTHSWLVYQAMRKLIDDIKFPVPPVGNFDSSKVRDLLLIAAVVHDVGKMRQKVQENLKKGTRAGEHYATKEELKQYFEKCNVSFSDDEFEFLFDLIKHHWKDWSDLKAQQTPGIGFFAQYLKIADWIASMHKLDFHWISILKERFSAFSDKTLVAVAISRFDSPSFQKIKDEILKVYTDAGWILIRHTDDGLLLAGTGKLPKKQIVVKRIYDDFISEFLKAIEPQFSGQSILDAIKKAFLLDWLRVQKNNIIDGFKNKNERYYFFLKLLRELLGLIDKRYEDYNFLKNIVRMRAHKLLSKSLGKEFSNPIDAINEAIKSLNIKLTDCIPLDLFSTLKLEDKAISKMKANELYEILEIIAENVVSRKTGELSKYLETQKIFLDYLNSIISLEEDLDFEKIAEDSLNAYKKYKTSRGFKSPRDVFLANCEYCGAPTVIPTQEALGLPDSKMFSTTKGRADTHMAICPLCVYDIQYMQSKLNLRKSDIKGNIPVFAKIKKAIYDISGTDYQLLIGELTTRKSISRLKTIKELPNRYKLPAIDKPKVPQPTIIGDERIYLLKTSAPNEIKNTQFEYMLLYWVLSNIGLRVNIGEISDNGYFGSTIFPDNAMYAQSIVIHLLAKAISTINPKMKVPYLRAGNMFNQNPAALFSTLIDYCDKVGQKKSSVILEEIFRNLKEVGRYMNVLEDAKFWAELLSSYFIDWDAVGGKLTKHSATKALARGLSVLVNTNNADFAFAEFMKYLREDLSSDTASTMKDRMQIAKKKFEEYGKYRSDDIGSFINFRNALISATYLLVRYKELRSVV